MSMLETQGHIVALDDGRVARVGAVQAFSVESQWAGEKILGITGVLWALMGAMRSGGAMRDPLGIPVAAPQVDGEPEAEQRFRGMPVRQRHLEKFGYSEGCKKCRHLREGNLSQPTLEHSPKCRERIQGLAEADEEFQDRAMQGAIRKGFARQHGDRAERRDEVEGDLITLVVANQELGIGTKGGDARLVVEEREPTPVGTDGVVAVEDKEEEPEINDAELQVPTVEEMEQSRMSE